MSAEFEAVTRLDSFPYRHRLSEVMARPVVTAQGSMTVRTACDVMRRTGVSSLLVLAADNRLAGIVTDGDIIAVIARLGADAIDRPLAEMMSAPVHCVRDDALLYVAVARMDRLGLTHLPVVDDDGRPIGMVTARQMLKARARQALVIGDDVLTAAGAADLAHARASLPGLAAGLRQDGAPAGAVAAVIGGVVRDITGRAASLVEASLFADGWGAPPSPYAVLVLGSAGRGESLLAFDQDNALVFLGDQALDPWFAEFGVRLNAMLDQAGILFCPGEVMVRSRQWRRSLDDWQSTLRHWVFQPDMQALLNVDIFFDMAFVHGDQALAIELRDYAFATAAQSAFFLQLLTHAVARLDSPLGAFGRLITQEGRFDAKKYGLLPLVSTARARGLGAHVTATGTIDRYRGLVEKGVMHADDMAGLAAAFEDILSAILAQQLADIAAGLPPGNKVAPEALPRAERDRLRSAFQRIKLLRAAAGTIMPAA